MSRRLRVFVSSTERDLANERAEVVRRLEDFNFEPVNAESMLPNGRGTWDRLRDEIQTSDLFVLILGESYGELPKAGPKSEEKKSVTELEFNEARRADLPVFVFMKRLRADVSRGSEDAARRDAFRRRVADWDGGYFRAEFELARDLADQVGKALVHFLTDQYQRERLSEQLARRPEPEETGLPPRMTLPHELVRCVAAGEAVLLLGAGASLQAGLPSAYAFITAMIERLRERDGSYVPAASGSLFNSVATDFEAILGPEKLHELARSLVDPRLAKPTAAHLVAARYFPTIVTTNYDLLVERALAAEGREERVISQEMPEMDLEGTALIKLHGSIGDPDHLVLTETELANLERTRPGMWAHVKELLRHRPLISVGSSLRDQSLIRLLEEAQPQLRGWAVLFEVTVPERVRLARWGLEPLQGDAWAFFSTLEQTLRQRADP